MDRTCEVCRQEASKYCCPACQMRTCSLTCVQAHKKESKCSGLKVAPSAPTVTSAKYDEEAFTQDYQFLEKVNSFAEVKQAVKVQKRDKRAQLARKFQQVAKLSEFHFLPETFSRAKVNQSKISRITAEAKQTGKESDEPESNSSRTQQMIWTVDLVSRPFSESKTIHGVADSEPLSSILGDLPVNRLFLKVESRKERIEEPLQEIPKEKWSESLYSVLQGAKFIEYPTFVYESFVVNE